MNRPSHHRRTLIAAGNACLWLAILAPPLPWPGPWDGLPWSGAGELLGAAVVLPALLLVAPGFWTRPRLAWVLAPLALGRLVVCLAAPAPGLELNVYQDAADLAAGRPQPTYQGLWTGGPGAVLRRPYGATAQFPLEWLNELDQPGRSQSRPVLTLSGWARVPAGCALSLEARGAEAGDLVLGGAPLAWGPSAPAPSAAGPAPERVSPLSGWLRLGPPDRPDWSLRPRLICPGRAPADALAAGVLWRSRAGAGQSPAVVAVWRWAQRVLDWGVVLVWGLWGLAALAGLWRRGTLDPGVALAAAGGLAWPWLGRALGADPLLDPARAATLATVVLAAWGWWRARRDPAWARSLGTRVLLAAGPALMSHYWLQWGPQADQWSLFSIGDDWLTYQRAARDIVLRGDWLHLRYSPVFYTQPLYRFLVAGLHGLFGDSSAAQRLMDVWAVLGAAALLPVLARRMGLTVAWALAAAPLYLYHLLADRFLFLMGVGLQEYLAMLTMMLAAWALGRRQGRPPGPWWPGLVAVVAFWLRQDHLGCLLTLGLWAFAPLTGGLVAAWRDLCILLWRRLGWLLGYAATLAAGVLAVLARNGLGGGQWVLTKSDNFEFLYTGTVERALGSVAVLINASDGPPGLAGRLIWVGLVAGAWGLVGRLGPWRRYPLELGLLLASIVVPYFLVVVSAYTPRFSIHLLPWAVLSVVCAGWATWEWAWSRARPGGLARGSLGRGGASPPAGDAGRAMGG